MNVSVCRQHCAIVAMSKYHVTCEYLHKPDQERKKILTLDDKRRYKERIRALFSLPADGQYTIHRFDDEDFNEWVDVDEYHELPDRGKLKIVVRSGRLFNLFYFILALTCFNYNISYYNSNATLLIHISKLMFLFNFYDTIRFVT